MTAQVSIVIPVYNGADYLGQAIDSALAQTYGNCEILVVNDGSNDGGETERIALSYGDRIRYFSKENGGVSSALNVGIANMAGEYFAWLSHDDEFLPDKIRLQVEFLQGRDDAVSYGDFEIIDSDSKPVGTRRERTIAPKLFRYSLLYSHPVHGCTVMIPKRILDEVGGFDESLRTVQDYDLWYRIALSYPFLHQDAVLSRYRLHEKQGTVTVKPECVRERNIFYRKHFDECLEEWHEGCSLSKLTFCLRSSLAFRNVSCPELADYASATGLSLLRSGTLPASLADCFWLAAFAFSALKRSARAGRVSTQGE